MDNKKKTHSLCVTLRVGKVAPPFVTDATNESQLKQSNIFPESPTNHTVVKMRMKWASVKFQGSSYSFQIPPSNQYMHKCVF